MSKGDIVISVQQKFVERIVAGEKAAELRRRAPRIQPGCRVWIYTKAPEAVISICVTVDRIVTGSPQDIWQSHRADLGVSLDEFEDYFAETQTGCAIFFNQVEDVSPGVALSEIRSKSKGFHPPQFFKRLEEGSPELKLFRSRLVCG
ncbi:MAG TPA: ASCH domain-containing protein [Candidatus Sulfotelmatobacter sp.]